MNTDEFVWSSLQLGFSFKDEPQQPPSVPKQFVRQKEIPLPPMTGAIERSVMMAHMKMQFFFIPMFQTAISQKK